MSEVAALVLAIGVGLVVYSYAGYPLLLLLLAPFKVRQAALAPPAGGEWPSLSITVPAYNEAATIAATIGRLLDLDYPGEQIQILVVSDASTDGTDAVVESYGERGVELLRMPVRGGKTAAENAAQPLLRGEIVVNTDASIHIRRDALKPLIAALRDPTVGVASGRDISVASVATETNAGESGYVGYEMWVRRLETRVQGIVGASGCFYAIRAHLHRTVMPVALSRDFAAAMIAREHGFRAVSVDEAVCYVPRTASLRAEYRRKVRTITRGIETLFYKRHLLNPVRHGLFSWMLFSHKVCRWLTPWAVALGFAAVGVLALEHGWARPPFVLGLAGLVLAGAGWVWPERRRMPRLLSVAAFAFAGNVAAMAACLKAARGEKNPIWEPTRREAR
jgi:cellulose synthase/poly-beta-1,6-N-acetylglucosamine synthase-like glycosyltransferase